MSEERRRVGIYLLPNLFTTAALFSGFYAIIAAMRGEYSLASMAIFLGAIADGLDGRVARLTNTASDFGKEYDSLSDMVTFGVAAALVMYIWSLNELAHYFEFGGKLGWAGAFIFCACAALRLARFNVAAASDSPEDKRYFTGLPSPAAAGLLAAFVWTFNEWGISGHAMAVPAWLLTVAAGALMVSNIRFRSFKDISLGEKVPFAYILIMVGVFILVALDPPRVLFFSFFIYAMHGPIGALMRRRARKKEQ